MAERPKNMVQALREVAACMKSAAGSDGYPDWFVEMQSRDPWGAWITLLSDSADELERMQKLNGKLYKTLYPD